MPKLNFVIVIALAGALTGCGRVDVRGGGLLPEETQRYSTFFTPTHEFQCRGFMNYTFHMIPGDRYGAGDLSNYRYKVGSTRTSESFPHNTVALRLTTRRAWQARHYFFIIDQNGNFVVKDHPNGFFVADMPEVSLSKLPCTNMDGIPAFKQITAADGA